MHFYLHADVQEGIINWLLFQWWCKFENMVGINKIDYCIDMYVRGAVI